MAIASNTPEIDGAKQLITKLRWNKYFSSKQINPLVRIEIQIKR